MSNEMTQDNNAPAVSCTTIPLKDVFTKNLTIPAYQRGYCWRRENVVKLLDALYSTIQSKDKAKFHLGTIIVKECRNEDKFESLIIDGQQRLITLALLFHALSSCVGKDLLKADISKTENISKEHVGYIVRAFKTIKAWLQDKKITHETLQGRIKVCRVTISSKESEDLAYKFFNATNATGKPLSDYDLLKTHHLRHVDHKIAGFVAGKWNTMYENEQKFLLNHMLYRLRNWSYQNKFDICPDEYGKRLLFEHYSVKHNLTNSIYSIPLSPQYDSIFSGGVDFFGFVESHKTHFRTFEEFECVKSLNNHLKFHNNGILCNAIKAITFLFYLKYDEYYITEALFCIAYRVSELRNEKQVRGDFISNRDIFKELVFIIDRSTTPGMLFAHCLSVENHYFSTGIDEEGVRGRYWEALKKLFEELPNNQILPIKKYADIIKKESPNEHNS